ncbi:MAG: hypothetical protein AB8G05_12140 [Oligoflexales bacterium]
MMVWEKNCLKLSIFLIMVCILTGESNANEIYEFLQKRMDVKKSVGVNFHHKQIKKEPLLEFFPDIHWLSKGKMQMALEEFYPENLGDFADWDIDRLHLDTDLDSGFLTLGKSAIIYQNRLPKFFSRKHFLTSSYLDCAFNGTTVQSIDRKNLQVSTLTKIKILGIKLASIETRVSVKIYEDLDSFLGAEVPINMESTWTEIAGSIPLPLERITTTSSGKYDITPNKNSVGGRTINFYYNIKGQHTFHLSIKVVSFKKVPIFARNTILDHQYTGTWESLNLIRSLPNQLLSRS